MKKIILIGLTIILLSGLFYIKMEAKKLIPIDKLEVQKSTEDFLEQREGSTNVVYKDSAGIDTVGIGHKVLPGDKLKTGERISDADKLKLFQKDTSIVVADIKSHITHPLTQNQFDALVSLVFNIGVGSFNSSTVLRELNQFLSDGIITNDEKQKLTDAWLSWKNAGGRPVLLTRRQKEVDLFFS